MGDGRWASQARAAAVVCTIFGRLFSWQTPAVPRGGHGGTRRPHPSHPATIAITMAH